MPEEIFEISIDDYIISTDQNKLDLELVFKFLHDEAYWSKGIPKEDVLTSLKNSLCFGLYLKEKMIGFARIVTDYSTFGYLADVFVIPEERGRGGGKALMKAIMKHPIVPSFRFFLLLTRNAHALYERYGFKRIANPERYMAIKKTLKEAYGKQ